MVRNGDEAKLVRWLRDANAAVMLAPHRWEGQYRQGAVWYPLGLTVNVVALPHEGCYRFFGSDADDVGPFTVIGEWSGELMEATKVYEMQSVEYKGEIDVSSGVWRGDWTVGSSQDQFILTLPLQRCPNCKDHRVPNRDEPCLNCLPEGYNADVSFETIEEQRLRLDEIQERIAAEILHKDEVRSSSPAPFFMAYDQRSWGARPSCAQRPKAGLRSFVFSCASAVPRPSSTPTTYYAPICYRTSSDLR